MSTTRPRLQAMTCQRSRSVPGSDAWITASSTGILSPCVSTPNNASARARRPTVLVPRATLVVGGLLAFATVRRRADMPPEVEVKEPPAFHCGLDAHRYASRARLPHECFGFCAAVIRAQTRCARTVCDALGPDGRAFVLNDHDVGLCARKSDDTN
jgi:hypothetical protein